MHAFTQCDCMQRLGKGLKDLPRDQIVLATKVGRYGPNAFANLFDWSAERVQGRPDSNHKSGILHGVCRKSRIWPLLLSIWLFHFQSNFARSPTSTVHACDSTLHATIT